MVSHDLSAYILEATRNWHVQRELADYRCVQGIGSSDTDITFSQGDATKIKSKQLSEFGSHKIL